MIAVVTVSAGFWWWRHGVPGLVAGLVAGVLLVAIETRLGLLAKISRGIASTVGHVLAALVQLVVLPGRRVEPPSGWITSTGWRAPDRSLGGGAPFPRRRLRLTVLVLAVLWADVASGVVVHELFTPESGVRPENRYEASGVADDRLAAIQDDAQDVAFVPRPPVGGVPLWTLEPVASPTLTFDAVTGRAGFVPSDAVFDVALIGASAAFSMGASDEESVASALARELQSRGPSVRVWTFAVPGFVAEQSVADLRARLESGARFDAVVLLTGFNDTFLSMYGPTGPLFMSDERFVAPKVTGAASWWADRSLASFLVGHRRRYDEPPMRRYSGAEHAFLAPDVLSAVSRASSRVEASLVALRTLAEEYGFAPVFAWTPSWLESPSEPPGTGGDISEEVRLRWRPVFVGVHERLVASTPVVLGGPFVAPSADVYGAGCFFDMTHHVGRCSSLVAAPIAAALVGLLEDASTLATSSRPVPQGKVS